MTGAALVTGGAKRLGREIALRLAQQGYDIALHYNHSKQAAQQTAADIEALGTQCSIFQADLADTDQCGALIEQAKQAYPDLRVLINNASVFDRGPFMNSDKALYDAQHNINVIAPIFLTQAFARGGQQGYVVNMIDASVAKNSHSYFFYLLSKKSLLEFTKMAAAELAPHIRVNGVCPGYVLPAPEFGDEYKVKLEAQLPMQKVATPDEVARAVAALIEMNVTGQIIYVDGGESL